MIKISTVRKWQSFYELVHRTKKTHYIYRNGEWFGFCLESQTSNRKITIPKFTFDDCYIEKQIRLALEDYPPKPPKGPEPRLVKSDKIGTLLLLLAATFSIFILVFYDGGVA